MEKLNYYISSFLRLLSTIYIINYTYSQTLNNIIRLTPPDFIYNHININSFGDMIIDTSSSNGKKRYFYALKNNGLPYFLNSYYNNKEVDRNDNIGRKEGETIFIKYNAMNEEKKECLLYIPQKETKYIEYYFLEENNNNINITFVETSNKFFEDILSSRFSILKNEYNFNTEFEYIFNFVGNSKLTVTKGHFDSNIDKMYSGEKIIAIKESNNMMTSCFFTQNKKYICFYFNTEKNIYYAIAFNSPISSENYKITKFAFNNKDDEDEDDEDDNERYEKIFSKAIHLKEEIGVFIYFINIKTNRLVLLFKEIKNDLSFENYNEIKQIELNYHYFSTSESLNDLIKLNNQQICYISTDNSKEYLYIIIITLFSLDMKVSLRDYVQYMIDYDIKFNTQIISNLYNNFITCVFSHSLENGINANNYYSSLIIFNYPSSDNYNIDIEEEIKTKKTTVNNLCFFLNDTLNITNNIFGYVFIGTKIIDFSEEIKLIYNNKIIDKNFILPKDKCLYISFPKINNLYQSNNYIIELAYVITEPDYERITTNNLYYLNGYTESELNEYQRLEKEEYIMNKQNYTGKYSNFSFIINHNIYCDDENCISCDNSSYSSSFCLICKDHFSTNELLNKCGINNENEKIEVFETSSIISFETDEKEKGTNKEEKDSTNSITDLTLTSIINSHKTELLIENISETYEISKISEISDLIINKSDDNINNCSINDIIKKKCKVSAEQLKEVYEQLKEKIKSNQSLIISLETVTFQITTLKEQKNNDNPNISSIDLGECEERIKSSKNLTENDNLIIYIIDIKNEDSSSIYVQYEIYHPITYEYINLDICKGLLININTPVYLNEESESIFNSLNNAGYNLFNLNDSFYNDICSTYTSLDGTDLTLLDRKNIIYDKNTNISMCQEGCNLLYYNSTIKKAKCDCEIQTNITETNIKKINFNKKELVSSFYKTLTNSNFLVLKCYKLVFSKKGQNKNYGSYSMSAMTFIYIILLIIFAFKGMNKINIYVKNILQQKLVFKLSKG